MNVFKVSGSHFDIGFSIGKKFSSEIHHVLETYDSLRNLFIPFHHSDIGQDIFDTLIALHNLHYPDYMKEIEGLANGSGCSFEELFILNMRSEYQGLADQGCSTCSLSSDSAAIIAHNEDGLPIFKDKIFVVEVEPIDKPAFTALSYPGFLYSTALGFNRCGICYTTNDIKPQNIKAGIGRHFIARSLFEANSIEEAVIRLTPPNRASGFNYTIGSIKEKRIINLEVAPERYAVREIHGAFFHANQYTELKNAPQIVPNSSKHRTQLAAAALQRKQLKNPDALLEILTDVSDPVYPMYRTAAAPDNLMTLSTAVFDLNLARLRLYQGNAVDDPDHFMDFEIQTSECSEPRA